ncbi:hypothetical protein M135_5420 [Bacteroides fragilis str. S36L5]|nr:hypothetical protein M135_5420 [Bacteroides fragilis str. S36L5]
MFGYYRIKEISLTLFIVDVVIMDLQRLLLISYLMFLLLHSCFPMELK